MSNYDNGALGSVSNITFRDIDIRSENGIVLSSRGHPIEGVVLDGIKLTMDKWTNYSHTYIDYQPAPQDDLLETPVYAVLLEQCRLSHVANVHVRFTPVTPPTWAYAPCHRSVNSTDSWLKIPHYDCRVPISAGSYSSAFAPW